MPLKLDMVSPWKRYLTGRNQLIIAGALMGIFAALLTNWGNPPNRGLTVTCFIRDTTGALGLHQAPGAQYIRPEIVGFVLGAFITSLLFREFKVRGGSSPLVRFLLGFFVMVGAEVFLACTTQVLIRLAGGDLNALAGLGGLIGGIIIGVFFLKRGFSLGRASRMHKASGFIMPLLMVVLLLLLVLRPVFISFSVVGAGSLHAAVWVSLAVGLGVGFLAQRTRLCFMAGWRNIFWIRDFDYFSGIAAFFVAVLVTNYVAGNFGANGFYHWGFADQPYAVDNQLWNFLSMVLVGLGTTLLGGCPLRQTILTGEGDIDAGVTLLGLFAGGALTQNFLIKSNDTFPGVNTYGPLAVMIGLAFCITLGFTMKEKT
jgi:YedE family putative selenium metabolism protein